MDRGCFCITIVIGWRIQCDVDLVVGGMGESIFAWWGKYSVARKGHKESGVVIAVYAVTGFFVM